MVGLTPFKLFSLVGVLKTPTTHKESLLGKEGLRVWGWLVGFELVCPDELGWGLSFFLSLELSWVK